MRLRGNQPVRKRPYSFEFPHSCQLVFKINEDISVARLFNGRVQPVLDANEHEAVPVFFALGLLAARRIRDQTLERGLES